MKQEFKTKEELVQYLRDLFAYKQASKEEVEKWPYLCELYTSPQNLIGKKLYHKNKNFVGKITKIELGKNRTRDGLIIFVEDKKYSPTDYCIELEDKIKGENVIYSLHPTKTGINFWQNGHIVNDKDFRSMYYTTDEYRQKFQDGMFKSYGLTGINSPCQVEEIGQKIKDTMLKNHGYSSFLSRGPHYSAITEVMMEKFGVENLFHDGDWQIQYQRINVTGFSKLEQNIIKELMEQIDFGDITYFTSDEKTSKSFHNNKPGRNYLTDFYSESKGIVIEVLGNYWHCNPNIYSPDFYNKTTHKYASEIWEKDEERKVFFEKEMKLIYFVIWEQDWYKNKEDIIFKIKNIVDEIDKNKIN